MNLFNKLIRKPTSGFMSDRITELTLPLSTLVRIVRARLKRDRAKKVYLLAHRSKVAVPSCDVLVAYNEWRRLDNEYLKLKRRLI